jgi:hypothetical protein
MICTARVKSTFLHAEADDRASSSSSSSNCRRRAWSLPSNPVSNRTCEHTDVLYVDEGLGAGWRRAVDGSGHDSKSSLSEQSTRSHSRHSTPRESQALEHASRGVLCNEVHIGLKTIMMRNLPKGYTREQLKQVLDLEGYFSKFDFLYVPYDFKTLTILGYAFINFISPDDAQRFRKDFAGFRRWGVPSGKVCNLSWANADQQGLDTNVERYRNSSVMHKSVPESCKPMVLVGGILVKFPKSSKKLWPPHSDFGNHARRSTK